MYSATRRGSEARRHTGTQRRRHRGSPEERCRYCLCLCYNGLTAHAAPLQLHSASFPCHAPPHSSVPEAHLRCPAARRHVDVTLRRLSHGDIDDSRTGDCGDCKIAAEVLGWPALAVLREGVAAAREEILRSKRKEQVGGREGDEMRCKEAYGRRQVDGGRGGGSKKHSREGEGGWAGAGHACHACVESEDQRWRKMRDKGETKVQGRMSSVSALRQRQRARVRACSCAGVRTHSSACVVTHIVP